MITNFSGRSSSDQDLNFLVLSTTYIENLHVIMLHSVCSNSDFSLNCLDSQKKSAQKKTPNNVEQQAQFYTVSSMIGAFKISGIR